jgi:hypothetical protein
MDIIHTEELVDAVLAAIEANAPEAWLESGNVECLRLLQFGDAREYAIRDANIAGECPAIWVRAIQATPQPEAGGIGGKFGTSDRLRVVMMRSETSTVDTAGNIINMARGKARYSALLYKAVFGSGYRLGSPEIATDDTSADVIRAEFASIDYSEGTPDTQAIADLGKRGLWAIAMDINIITSTV